MIYYEEIVPFEPDGKDGHWHEDYWKEFSGRLAPTMSRLGIPVVGVWETPPGAGQGSECVFLYRTESYATYGDFIARTHGAAVDPVVHKRRGEMWVYRQRWFTKILLTTPGHEVSLL